MLFHWSHINVLFVSYRCVVLYKGVADECVVSYEIMLFYWSHINVFFVSYGCVVLYKLVSDGCVVSYKCTSRFFVSENMQPYGCVCVFVCVYACMCVFVYVRVRVRGCVCVCLKQAAPENVNWGIQNRCH